MTESRIVQRRMKPVLLGLGGGESINRKAESGFVTVAGVFLEDALADRAVDGGKRGAKQISSGCGVFRGNSRTQPLHDGPHARGIRAVEFSAHAGLPGSLQN